MKFRIFLGIICLAFVATLLMYGSNQLAPDLAESEQEVAPTPEFVAEIPEVISCEGEEIAFANGPLVVGFVGRPSTLLPFSVQSDGGARSQIETELSKLIFRGLVRFTSTGEPVPDLASWHVAEDSMSVTFMLDQGGIWHDGTPVTSADVAFTINALATGSYNNPGNFPWETVMVQIIDSATVQLNLPVPFSPLLEAATVGLLPAHLGLDGQNLQNSSYAGQPIGNGDFRVVNSWENDGLVLLEPVESAILNTVEVRFYPSVESMTADFSTESVDFAILPTYTTIQAFEGIPAEQFNLFSGPASQATQLFFRMDGNVNPAITTTLPIEDPVVRQALRLGLDRRLLIDEAVAGQAVLTEGPWSFDNYFQDELQFPMIQTDVASAASLLDEAGWLLPAEGLGGSVRQKDGINLELSILVSSRGQGNAIGAELARQWSDLGVRAVVTTLNPAEFQSAIAGRQFDIAVQKIRLSNDPDLYDFWSQEAIIRGQNISRWNNRSASEALEAGRQVWDYELRKPYYNAFRTFYEKELPAFSLFQDIRTIAVNPRVGGQMIGYPGDLGEFMGQFSQWYILEEDIETLCS